MKNYLKYFPDEVKKDIDSIVKNNGILGFEACKRVCQQLAISVEELMLKLVPLAASFAVAPISDFKVGAVVKGDIKDQQGSANLYLGANMEFSGQGLCHTLHAEQSAVSNAWLAAERRITAIAISAAPCGHCRQFLYEVAAQKPLLIVIDNDNLTDATNKKGWTSKDLTLLLPMAFGPQELGSDESLIESCDSPKGLSLVENCNCKLVISTLQQANFSYAPYSRNYAGCSIQLVSGEVFIGRYAENAAFNPSLTPIVGALSKMIFTGFTLEAAPIRKVVLVEQLTKVSQKKMTENILASISPDTELEYFSTSKI